MSDTHDTTDFTDSDDELLGLNDDPIPIQKLYLDNPPPKINNQIIFDKSDIINNRNSNLNDNNADDINISKFVEPTMPPIDETDGWTFCGKKRERKNKSNNNNKNIHKFQSEYNNRRNKITNNSIKRITLSKINQKQSNNNNIINKSHITGRIQSQPKFDHNNNYKQLLLAPEPSHSLLDITPKSSKRRTIKKSQSLHLFPISKGKLSEETFTKRRTPDMKLTHNDLCDDSPWNNILEPKLTHSMSNEQFFASDRGEISPREIIFNHIDDELPSMEFIRPEQKSIKYQRMKEIPNVIGYIVNIHDATNFDIDLDISAELHEKYRDVISNQYTYKDLGSNFLENPDFNKIVEIKPQVGTTYRCRLKGVGINQLPHAEHTWKSYLMCVDIKQLIDRTDGWVKCCLSDIDVYSRLLVDIIVDTCNGPINVRDYLLYKMQNEINPIFYPYCGRRDRGMSH